MQNALYIRFALTLALIIVEIIALQVFGVHGS